MVFSSYYFLFVFLPLFLLLYWTAPPRLRNAVALGGSCFFYAWGAPEFFLVVLLSLLLDFYLVRLMALSEGRRKRRLLTLAVGQNLLILFTVKYLDFFLGNLNLLLEGLELGGIPLAKIVLPIGVSFITFQKISYVVDCHYGKARPMEHFRDHALYILLFPQLIAGPIVRFREIADQLLERRHQDTLDEKLGGAFRFFIGLAKKVLIADVLGQTADEIFALPNHQLNTPTAWVGILAYAFQIYFDFAGYSDMAIGLARILGFRFPENFHFPYTARSVTEFWRRWHITLSNWMRDYLYIPLGGNRVPRWRLLFNLVVVFLLSGLWHGAAWTFVFWGAFHGFFLVLERFYLGERLARAPWGVGMAYTFGVVLVGWVFFRAQDFGFAWDYLGAMVLPRGEHLQVFTTAKFWFTMALAAAGSFAGAFKGLEHRLLQFFEGDAAPPALVVRSATCFVLGLLCVGEILASDFNPFIYFQF